MFESLHKLRNQVEMIEFFLITYVNKLDKFPIADQVKLFVQLILD